jgi:hypothetical protein
MEPIQGRLCPWCLALVAMAYLGACLPAEGSHDFGDGAMPDATTHRDAGGGSDAVSADRGSTSADGGKSDGQDAGSNGRVDGGGSANPDGGNSEWTKPPAQAYFFVAPTGSDGNPGSEAAPFETIAKARDAVRQINGSMTADIYVFLRGGDYRVTGAIAFGPQDSGTNGHRIHYQAYPGEVPVVNGATRVTGWSQHSGNIYKASLSRTTKLRNLYVNDERAAMTSKRVAAKGGQGTYSVSSGKAAWAWISGSNADGVKYGSGDLPAIANNKDDLEIVNGTTWNENIVCVRDVVTASDGGRALLLQQPYGAIAQQPGWNSGFSTSGTHTVFNAFELLNSAGQFYFDKSTGTLYYFIRAGQDMSTADVEAPVAESLLDIAGTSNSARVKNLTFQGITFANTDWGLAKVDGSCGKGSVQGATYFVAYGSGDWHSTKYQILDTLPGVINVQSADSIEFIGNVVKHSGSEGLSMTNDVINSTVVGNYITDISGSGITVGHPQHVFLGDGGAHEKFAKGVEGICTKITISNNLLTNLSMVPGFGGHSGITAFFVEGLAITHNHIQSTAYNGLNLGWGWQNFLDSTTCRSNTVNNNRFFDHMRRLHDSGAVYTLGQMPETTINQNYVKGIPPATSGPTYGLHNDEGSAFITENENVLDIDPGVKYTINSEDFGRKHDLTILKTYATVNKMGATPPSSKIDPPVAVADNVWPLAQYTICLNAGIEDAYRAIIPSTVLAIENHVFPASCAAPAGTASLPIRSSGTASNTVWLAPAGTTRFTEGPNMTKAAGDSTSIPVPATSGTYKLHVLDSAGKKLGESAAQLRVKS